DGRRQVSQVPCQVLTCVVDQLGGSVAESAQFIERGRDPRPFAKKDVQRRRDLVQRLSEHVALIREGAPKAVQGLNRCDDVVALLIKHTDELVQSLQQVADVGAASGQRGIEVMNDVADLAQATGTEDNRSGRKCLL